jgi:3-methylcrotonyl-CoA carboxylase alpha subunit
MFRKLLIANRGEIALRIMRACREMGIATVAIYSEADANAQHVWQADEAELVGPAPAADSYLQIERIIAAASKHGCDAIHPGYGFLSENATFAEAVGTAGFCFIGPDPATIRAMGSKTAARQRMGEAGVPVVPGYHSESDDRTLQDAAHALGYPLLVKAAVGGGGKGMKTVSHEAELLPAIHSARREAQNAFGDDQLFLEKLIENPRHIEFQILGDHFGTVVHLFERECSIQRRHQKIVEETPSPFLDESLRQRMGEAAVAAARAADYVNAGTVEFLVDERGDFYFLEMNTRLQVEHPITEWVTGLDLVKLQIKIAAGEPLPFTQAELHQRGHAIECRIYAEDPAHGFVPAAGTLQLVKEPQAPGVRVDSGVVSGDQVSPHYDPLLAKLSVLGMDRNDAIARMARALADYVILGDVVTNLAFLRTLCRHPAFRAGETTTAFIDQHLAGWRETISPPSDLLLVAAALAETLERGAQPARQSAPTATDPYSPWQQLQGFRTGVSDG